MLNVIVGFILAIVNAMIIDNVVLSRFYGICPFLGVSRKVESSLGMGIAVTLVIIIASAICWPIYQLLKVAGIPFLDTIVYILVIASLVQIAGLIIKKYTPGLYQVLGIYLPLITTNCAVLGVVQSNTDQSLDFLNSMANAIGTSLGFFLIMIVFAAIRTRLEQNSDTPKAFKGLPIALITAAIMALAFLGLGGMI